MFAILIVGLGGFLGSVARYLVGLGVQGIFENSLRFPIATCIVNVFGSFLIGVLFQCLGDHQTGSSTAKLFLATGVLGGFTTFSTFSLETVSLLRQGEMIWAFFNVTSQLVLGLLAVFAGLLSAKTILG